VPGDATLLFDYITKSTLKPPWVLHRVEHVARGRLPGHAGKDDWFSSAAANVLHFVEVTFLPSVENFIGQQ
jgi:hypothetical protein